MTCDAAGLQFPPFERHAGGWLMVHGRGDEPAVAKPLNGKQVWKRFHERECGHTLAGWRG